MTEIKNEKKQLCYRNSGKWDRQINLIKKRGYWGSGVGQGQTQVFEDRHGPKKGLVDFTIDLTIEAEQGKLDPVIGRDKEIARVLQILCRRRKNNPILIGEPGVGKTAVAEGLAMKIANEDVPTDLLEKSIVLLDIGLLLAGTKYRGEFEERLKNVLDDIQLSGDIIIVIDEVHTLIGAGAAEGALDAANILKPALARGELQCIGATTLTEYRQYIQRDSALDRRFQPVLVEEPKVDEAVIILEGLRLRYEDHHQLIITDQALRACAEFSARYIADRFLPDKAIDLMDEASSRVRLNATILPEVTKEFEQELSRLTGQLDGFIRNQNFEEAEKYKVEIDLIKRAIKAIVVAEEIHANDMFDKFINKEEVLTDPYVQGTKQIKKYKVNGQIPLFDRLEQAEEELKNLKEEAEYRRQRDIEFEQLEKRLVARRNRNARIKAEYSVRIDEHNDLLKRYRNFLDDVLAKKATYKTLLEFGKDLGFSHVAFERPPAPDFSLENDEIWQLEEQEALEKRNREMTKIQKQRAFLQKAVESHLAYRRENYLTPMVTENDVAQVVASWTGIPINKITRDETRKLQDLEHSLHERVIGQNQAVHAIARAVRRSRVGLRNPSRPIASFLFSGPTGVGKTELAKTLAAQIFGSESSMVRLDMSEFMERHTVAKLIGSPPGYVGYEEGGQLTEAVKRKAYSLVLFDEIEKAHPDVFNLLLQILDDGRLTDGKGTVIDFKNTIIIMTSNLGSSIIVSEGNKMDTGIKKRPPLLNPNDKDNLYITNDELRYKRICTLVKQELQNFFKPEFLNRIDEVIVFEQLNKIQVNEIAKIMIKDLKTRLRSKEIILLITSAALRKVVEVGFDQNFGARPLRRAVTELIEDKIASTYLENTYKVQKGTHIFVDVDNKFNITVQVLTPLEAKTELVINKKGEAELKKLEAIEAQKPKAQINQEKLDRVLKEIIKVQKKLSEPTYAQVQSLKYRKERAREIMLQKQKISARKYAWLPKKQSDYYE